MYLLSIDPGHYSIKLTLCFLEKKNLVLKTYDEIRLDPLIPALPNEQEPTGGLKGQFNKEYIDNFYSQIVEFVSKNIPKEFTGKILTHIPNELLTTRYLEFPITNTKKINLMIPFKLDQSLPFSSSESHYFTIFSKLGSNTKAIVNITKKESFINFYNKFNDKNITPHFISSELSFINSYVDSYQKTSLYAILDIGHSSTKCYIVLKDQIISNHFSFIAGKSINEMIGKTYNLSIDETVKFKHNKAFFLTKSMTKNVDTDQLEFSKLMDKVVSPLVLDLKRWFVGAQMKTGMHVNKIYLIGGTSNIQNIDQYISEETGVNTDFLNPLNNISNIYDFRDINTNSFSMSIIQCFSNLTSKRPGNFLFGEFNNIDNQAIPLHSSAFIFSRGLILFLLLSFFVLTESFLLNKEVKIIKKKNKKSIKNPLYALTSKDRSTYRKRPTLFLKRLKRKNKNIVQEVKLIESSSRKNTLYPLIKISEILNLKTSSSFLESIESDGTLSYLHFKAKTTQDILKLKEKIEVSNIITSKVKLNKEDKTLIITIESINE